MEAVNEKSNIHKFPNSARQNADPLETSACGIDTALFLGRNDWIENVLQDISKLLAKENQPVLQDLILDVIHQFEEKKIARK